MDVRLSHAPEIERKVFRMKKVMCLLVLVVFAICIATLGVAEEEKIIVGLSLNFQDETNQRMLGEYEKLIAEKYPMIDLRVTNALYDTARQLADVESLIEQECKIIIFRSIDADSGVACIEAIHNAGIISVLSDCSVNSDLWDVRVMGEQRDHGLAIGRYIQSMLDEDPDLVLNMGYIHGGTTENIMKRESGIYEACTSDRLHTLVTGCAYWNAEKAMAMAEDWLQAYPEMNCIATASDEMSVGAIQALLAAGVDMDHFYVFGVDGNPVGQEYIRSGELTATSYQDVGGLVDKTLEVCVGLAHGETYEKEVNPHNFYTMTKENIDEILGNSNE